MTVRVVSLFSGIGGSDLGMYAAARELGVDVEVVLAIDHDAKAVEVYNANLPHPNARVGDVKQMMRADLPPHDLVIGGPPCQPFSTAGRGLGVDDARNCIPDFLRLAAGSAWMMENVKRNLVDAPYSVHLEAAAFGDVTTRRRWFYSTHVVHVIETPGPRRVRDIRERAGIIGVRSGDGNGAKPCLDDGFLPSLTGKSNNNTHSQALKALALRGHGNAATVQREHGFLGTITATSHHGNAATQLEFVNARNVTLLEMQRAHSFSDAFDWCGANETQRGYMIANSWPIGMATAVCRAMLVAIGAVEAAA
ncbi:MAG: dcm [Candidatus Eremiobacteraeota bacterium]|nr:dcm [Candidatus Eremiobacteraeota bacterium]